MYVNANLPVHSTCLGDLVNKGPVIGLLGGPCGSRNSLKTGFPPSSLLEVADSEARARFSDPWFFSPAGAAWLLEMTPLVPA